MINLNHIIRTILANFLKISLFDTALKKNLFGFEYTVVGHSNRNIPKTFPSLTEKPLPLGLLKLFVSCVVFTMLVSDKPTLCLFGHFFYGTLLEGCSFW